MLCKVEKERTELQVNVRKLEKEKIELRKQLDKKHISEDFTDYVGALFKRDSSGVYAAPFAFFGYTIMIHDSLNLIMSRLNSFRGQKQVWEYQFCLLPYGYRKRMNKSQ